MSVALPGGQRRLGAPELESIGSIAITPAVGAVSCECTLEVAAPLSVNGVTVLAVVAAGVAVFPACAADTSGFGTRGNQDSTKGCDRERNLHSRRRSLRLKLEINTTESHFITGLSFTMK